MKLWKRLGAAALAVVTAVGLTLSSANACTSLFVGGALTENGSTFFGRGEDIGEHYAKIFQVIEAADHEEGEIYEDSAGFSMPIISIKVGTISASRPPSFNVYAGS